MDTFGFLYMWNYDERQIPFFPSSYMPIYRYAWYDIRAGFLSLIKRQFQEILGFGKMPLLVVFPHLGRIFVPRGRLRKEG